MTAPLAVENSTFDTKRRERERSWSCCGSSQNTPTHSHNLVRLKAIVNLPGSLRSAVVSRRNSVAVDPVRPEKHGGVQWHKAGVGDQGEAI